MFSADIIHFIQSAASDSHPILSKPVKTSNCRLSLGFMVLIISHCLAKQTKINSPESHIKGLLEKTNRSVHKTCQFSGAFADIEGFFKRPRKGLQLDDLNFEIILKI